jgi:hypothetical protein
MVMMVMMVIRIVIVGRWLLLNVVRMVMRLADVMLLGRGKTISKEVW